MDAPLSENVPALPAINQLLQQLQQQQQQLQQQQQQLQQQLQQQFALLFNCLGRVTDSVNDLQARSEYHSFSHYVCSCYSSISHIPMQLYNTNASLEAPLQYPQGIVVGPPLPLTKQELSTLSSRLRQ